MATLINRNPDEKLKILVTGASGFIGRNLVKRLVEEGRTVICLVREASNISSLKRLGVKIVFGDLCNKMSLKNILKDEEISTVYHLGGAVYLLKTRQFYEVNTNGTKNLLSECPQRGIKKFIYLSSIAVNEFLTERKLITESSFCNPCTPYGASKLMAENLILDFYNNSNTSVSIVRAPVVYGPDGQSNLLTRNFNKILNGKVYLINAGTNLRSLCYIDNLIDGLVLVEKNAKLKNNIYVIADNEIYSFSKIINTIASAYNISVKKIYVPSFIASLAAYALQLFCFLGFYSWNLYSLATMNVNIGCDISHAKEELGYYPKISLEDGIKCTIQWYRNKGVLPS